MTLSPSWTVNDRSDWPEPRPRVASWDEFVELVDGKGRLLGDRAVELCEVAGLFLDEWQEITLRIWLGVRPENPALWAHRRCGLIVPRQDGKGAILEARQLAGLFLIEDERLIIHTAHETKTSFESFLRLSTLIQETPVLNRQLARNGITVANGKEGIKLANNKRVKFLARSEKSGRGFSCDCLIYDEAMAGLTPKMVGASGPTQSARPNPQTIYTATAGDDSAEVLAQVREQGILGTRRLAFVEYAAGTPDNHTGEGIDLDDRDEWFRANPAMWGDNPRMTVEAVENDRDMMDEENFARERLCLWWVGKRASVIDTEQWESLLTDSGNPDTTRVAFAVDAPPERDTVSIGVASDLGDGRRHIEVVDRRKGTAWVVPRLLELDAKWRPGHVAVAPNSPAGALINDITAALEKAGVPVLTVSGTELQAACGQIMDKINDQLLVVHRGPHEAALSSAVDALRKRDFPEGGFVWHRRDTTSDISPFMVCTLASYAVGKPSKRKRKTGRASF